MIEIIFSESAGGGLKEAQSYGEGPFQEEIGSIGFIDDENIITKQEIEELQKEFYEQERKEWENSKPLGGNAADVFAFNLMLDIGDISEDIPNSKRVQIINDLWNMYPENIGGEAADTVIKNAVTNLDVIEKRITGGESIRVWYSNNPSELCGLFWFMSWLSGLTKQPSEIAIVKLPDFFVDHNGNIETWTGWGEVNTSIYSRFLDTQQNVPFEFCQSCNTLWYEHKKKNAPLRVVLNGGLTSVPVDFYDTFIIRASNKMDEEFREGHLIGEVISTYQFGVHDSFIGKRIDHMIDKGLLEVVENGEEDSPYSRVLKKCNKK